MEIEITDCNDKNLKYIAVRDGFNVLNIGTLDPEECNEIATELIH